MRQNRFLTLSAVFCLTAKAVFASQAPSLEDFLSAPFLHSLVGAAKANRFVWVMEERGRRNLWTAAGPDYHPHALTQHDSDDGQELTDVVISDDGEAVAYVRGGANNKEGNPPNPASNPKEVKREVWVLSVSEKKPRKVAEGGAVALSPDGKSIVFAKGNQLFWSPVAGADQPQALLKGRGDLRMAKWSPDGSKIAFISSRAEDRYSFVGVYDRKSERMTWMSPSTDLDVDLTWSPDGKRVAFVRLEGRSPEPSLEPEPGRHFSLWTADASSGAGQAIWTSPDETGGFAQTYPRPALFWTADHHLLFYWEKDGWMRIYSVSASGGNAVALTPSGCETDQAALSRERAELVFTSNCEDPDRRHVWLTPIAGGKAKRLASGNFLEWSPAFAGSGKEIAFLQAGALRPARPVVWSRDPGGAPKVLGLELLKSYPVDALVEPKATEFQAADGTRLHGQLFLPRGLHEGDRRPALIYLHGGPIRQMRLGWHDRDYYHRGYAMNQFLTSHGYVVLALNYRRGIGYGRAFRNVPTAGANGASEYQDVLAAAKYLQGRHEVDPKKIGLWGGSYGGYLTALGLARDSKIFAAGVDFHGVHDWSRQIRHLEDIHSPQTRDAALTLAQASSPIAAVETWTSPVLLIHGDDDRNVDFLQTTELIHRLRTAKRAHLETLVFPDEVHSFLRHESWLRAFQATVDFFDRFLPKAARAAR